jgi:hypothetical protein
VRCAARAPLKIPSFCFLDFCQLALKLGDTLTMKRKSETPANGKAKKRAISDVEAHANFRNGLFDGKVLEGYADYYAASKP